MPGFRTCQFIPTAARDALDYFRRSADLLSALRDARGIACSQAADNLEHAIKLARV